jgi:hypothetical protein
MFTRIGSVGILLVALGFVAAGEGSPHEQLIQKTLGTLDLINEELTKIMDEETALAAKPELRKAAKTWAETQAKAKKLQPPDKDEKIRLEKLYKPKLDESMKKLLTQKVRVELIAGGKDALKEINSVLKPDGKKQTEP